MPIFSEGAEPDVLFQLGSFRMRVVAPPALGGSDPDPARGPIDGAGVARGLDEGLDEQGRCVVALGPVLGQALAHEGEDVRAEVGDLDLRQYQEPRIVDHKVQVLLALLGRPSDEVVAWGELPCRSGEAEQGDGPAVSVVDGVAHLGADQGLVSEIVVAGDELVPQPALAGAVYDGADLQRTDLVEGRRNREQGRLGVGSEDDGLWPAPLPSGWRQLDEAIGNRWGGRPSRRHRDVPGWRCC